jgi:hypothetical protein
VSKLPFVVAPRKPELRRVGDEVSGVLEVPVLGGITVGEAAVVADLLASEQSSYVAGARIADAIAKEENITINEAFHIVESAAFGRPLEEAADAIRLKHLERINEVARIFAQTSRLNMEASVTALLRCRLNLPDWKVSDTRTLFGKLFEDLWQLVQDEQDAEDLSTTPPTEESLKKPQPVTTSAPKRTGRKSSTT